MKSPARQQYLDLKQQHPDAILLYRMGDFYEMFDADAEIASKVLGIQLTARSYPRGEGRIPMAGVPHHSVQGYIKRLIEAGYRVALCEQITEAGKGLVERAVVRVFTPGTVVEPEMLQPGENNYLAAVHLGKSNIGLAYVDVTTGEFRATQFSGAAAASDLEAELLRVAPVECLMPDSELEIDLPPRTSRRAVGSAIDPKAGADRLLRHFKVGSLGGFGLADAPAATAAAATVLEYLGDTHRAVLDLLQVIHTYSTERFMVLDRFTRSSLEIVPAAGAAGRPWTLSRVLDRTKTGMGSRRLRSMLGQPLLDRAEIMDRLDAVGAMTRAPMAIRRLAEGLARVGDVERVAGRIVHGKATGGDLTQLRLSLHETEGIKDLLSADIPGLEAIARRLDPCSELSEVIEQSIDLETGGLIKAGYSDELDQMRAAVNGARDAIAAIERDEIAATGIKSLKIGYNKVFGYYIEVSKPGRQNVPDRYVRQQTLINAERYFTRELKEIESTILGAREAAEALEKRLFEGVVEQIRSRHMRLMATAAALADLDVFRSLADVALTNNYVRPELDESSGLTILQGRHPVVEAASPDLAFVPNDCCFDEAQRIIILMGPNMGGKSTMLRMTALIVLMAQVGAFVPAAQARIGIVDRIFSRVGAQDDISAGQSTFMTEMVETANILHHATRKSLLILDEIGRGTSTYDGLAIARAVVEYIHARIGARTLFATHYHELAALEGELDHVRNFHTAVADHEGRIIFLHKIEPGSADRSYGVHVARLAGLPHSVTVRAERILRQLERSANGAKPPPGPQLALFSDPDLAPKSESEAVAIRVLDELLALDLSNTTPLEALERMHRFQEEGRSSR
jgi:DNA mismatch repair protein MutS